MSAQDVRMRLEGYAKTKVSSIFQPLAEAILVDQPGDPVDYMVRYLVSNRSDLRHLVVKETLEVQDTFGRAAVPLVDHPLLDKIAELEKGLAAENRLRRKQLKAAAAEYTALEQRLAEQEARLVAAGMLSDESMTPELVRFLEWEEGERLASVADPKDTEDFKFRHYRSVPRFTPQHTALLTGVLAAEDFEAAGGRKTQSSFTFSNFIQAGVTARSVQVGVACGDAECCVLFRPLFSKLVKAVHALDPAKQKFHSLLDASRLSLTESELDALAQCVTGVRMQATRNVATRPFPAGVRADERADLLEYLSKVLRAVPEELTGAGWAQTAVADIDPDDEDRLERRSMLIPNPGKESLATASGIARDWPRDRAMFWSGDLSTAAWVNGHDHLALVVADDGHDVAGAFRRFCDLIADVEERLRKGGGDYALDPLFGFLCTCPSMHGTAFTARVVFRVPTQRRETESLFAAARKADLRLTKLEPQPEDADEGIEEWELSSTKLFGLSEVEAVQAVVAGVTAICNAAKDLPGIVDR